MLRILTLKDATATQLRQAAAILVDAFQEMAPGAWPDLEAAEMEVSGSLAEGRLGFVAVDANDAVVGWIGGISLYDGNVWELHPLAVRPDRQRRGVGRALVRRLEAEVAARGAITLWVGTDDESAMTSLSGADLYPDLLGALARIRNLRRHPYDFDRRLGFQLAGVVPDANGFGKPDLLMAKRVRAPEPGALRGVLETS